jgi:hypothetical protein
MEMQLLKINDLKRDVDDCGKVTPNPRFGAD